VEEAYDGQLKASSACFHYCPVNIKIVNNGFGVLVDSSL